MTAIASTAKSLQTNAAGFAAGFSFGETCALLPRDGFFVVLAARFGLHKKVEPAS